MLNHRTLLAVLVAWLALASGCVFEPRRTVGEQCELNSECQAPLVCRLGRCRNECLTTRDCGLGLRCVLAPDKLGVCQLPDEMECAADGDCPESLVCSEEQGCTNTCADGEGCVAGAACDEANDGGGVCTEPQSGGCIYNSDCAQPLICRDGRCATECAEDSDCENPAHSCVAHQGCGGRPCACRHRCDPEEPESCPVAGTECVHLSDELDPPGTCERTSE